MSTKNVTVTVASVVVARAGFINWIQGTGTSYTVAVDAQTDYITVTDTGSLTVSDIGAVSVVNGGLETVNAVGNSSTSQTIGLTLGNIQTYTVNGNCTFTMPSGLTSSKGISFTVILTDSGGPRNITFTGVLWSGGTDPTAMSAASAIDIYSFLTINGGTTWYGFKGGTGMAT